MPSSANSLDAFKLAVNSAQPKQGKHIAACFREAYEEIERQLPRQISLKAILEAFNNAFDLSVSLARFRQLLAAERKLRRAPPDVSAPPFHDQRGSAADADTDTALVRIEEGSEGGDQ